MKLKKNWFYFLIVLLAIMGILYTFTYSFVSLSKNSRSGYLIQAGVCLILPGIWIILQIASKVGFRLKLGEKLSQNKKWVRWVENVLVVIVLVLAAGIRIGLTRQMPEAYLSESRDYYDIALAIMDGSFLQFGKGYCDAIADTPTVMGYSYLLTYAFRIWGQGVRAGQYLNVVFSVGSAFLSYKIVRKAGGRIGGIMALVLCAFWPSRIMAVNLLSGENAFLFLALLCIWIYLSLIVDYDGETLDGMQAVFLYLVLGALLAVLAAVNAAAVLLLLAMLIFLLPQQMKLPAKPKNDIPLMVRLLKRGWMRCILILIPYIIVAGVISSNIELGIDRDVSFTKIACGSDLWEEINDTFGVEKNNRNFKYFAERYTKLIDNDDLEIEKCMELLENQEDFTKEQRNYYDKVSSFNQIFYVMAAFFSLICLFFLLYEEANPLVMLLLMFLGFGVAAFLTGSGDEFHFMISQVFILLGSMSIWYTFKSGYLKAGKAGTERELLLKEEEFEKYKLQMIEQEEEKLAELRKEAYANVFDMKKALQEGHVIMTVSKAYENDTVEDSGRENTRGPAEKTDKETEYMTEDDFDWHFTEEELNSLVDKNWTAVKEFVHKKNQE